MINANFFYAFRSVCTLCRWRFVSLASMPLMVLTALASTTVVAQTITTEDNTASDVPSTKEVAASPIPESLKDQIAPGMTLDELRTLIGRPADHIDTVGACGIMQTRNWISEDLRILSTGSRVTSVLPRSTSE